MGIIVFVAGEAIPLQFHFEDRFDMTGGTLGLAVRADQRIAGVLAVVEAHFRPAAAGMAGFAALAEMPFVIVVFEMTRDAGHLEFVRERVFTMATVAVLLRMLAVEYEIRIPIVIEARIVPATRAVAVAALIAATTIVCIVFRVTVVALRRGVLKRVVGMAVETCRLLVLADQRVVGRVVVELDVEPLRGRMTVAARRSQCFSVRVVVFMTGIAVAGSVAMFLVRSMARGAFGFGMFAKQWEIGEIVVECLFIQLHDVGISTLVIRMAARAGRILRLLESAVEARRLVDVVGDVFVTVKA